MARAEAYLHAKFHLDPSNRLVTVHERHRQTDRQDRTGQDRTGQDNGPIAQGEPFYKRSPKKVLLGFRVSVRLPIFSDPGGIISR